MSPDDAADALPQFRSERQRSHELSSSLDRVGTISESTQACQPPGRHSRSSTTDRDRTAVDVVSAIVAMPADRASRGPVSSTEACDDGHEAWGRIGSATAGPMVRSTDAFLVHRRRTTFLQSMYHRFDEVARSMIGLHVETRRDGAARHTVLMLPRLIAEGAIFLGDSIRITASGGSRCENNRRP